MSISCMLRGHSPMVISSKPLDSRTIILHLECARCHRLIDALVIDGKRVEPTGKWRKGG
jgi:hypothetical protein